MKHTCISSKMKKGKPLMDDKSISRHVPKTQWFHDSGLQGMLRTFSTLYIKPDHGSSGNGIIRVKKLSDSESLISFKQTSLRCSKKKVISEIKKRMNHNKKYIIQQGITLATYHHRPFDLRVVLQKPAKHWQLNWMSAKVAPRSTSIVTNVSKGAMDMKIKKTLLGADQPLNVPKVMKELTEVSYQIAKKLGSHFPFRIVGLDMGIDRKGKVWFIEANTKPNFHGLGKLDPKQYQRYLKAQKLIDLQRKG
jgi:hypothetical protein